MDWQLLRKMKKTACWMISLIGAILIFSYSAYAQGQPQVIGILVNGLLVNKGSLDGVRVGSKGKIYYKETISGKQVNNYIALFEVTQAEKNTCQAKITKKQKELQIGFLVLFTTPLASPAVADDAKAPVVKKAEKANDEGIEVTFWGSVKNSQDPEDYRAYLKKYPRGAFADLANNRIAILAAEMKPPATEKEGVDAAALKRISLFELDQRLVQAYGQKMQRIVISLSSESVNAFGQVTVLLEVDDAGKVSLDSMDAVSLTVEPVSSQLRVQSQISEAVASIRLNPPKNRSGQPVVLENWRLSFKVITLAGKITLIKQ